MARLLGDEAGVAFVLALTDEVLRIRQPERAARHLASIVQGARSSDWLGPLDRLLLGVGAASAQRFPRLVMPLVAGRLRAELAGYVLRAEHRPLGRHLARRRADGIRLNLNLLGEAVLGDGEAGRRLDAVGRLLTRSDVDYVSVKITSVCSQINVLAFDDEVDRIAASLRRLYDLAGADGRRRFVNLDMEEYRDLELTVATFRRVLDEPAYRHLDAGIVLQAYLPDSLARLEELAGWARARRVAGGGHIKVRIVKGANLAMERVEAELAGWVQAPFVTKDEVDASYKRMLDAALRPDNADALRVGLASHNLFELGWGLAVAADRGLSHMVEAEMLEGMAGSTAGPLRDVAGGLLLYAPIVHRADDESAVAYLVRRFDENTGPDNFLRHQFDLAVGTPTWEAERLRFERSVAASHLHAAPTRRRQDRSAGTVAPADPWPPADGTVAPGHEAPAPGGLGPDQDRDADPARRAGADARATFANEADTDLTRPANREWLRGHLAAGLPADLVVPAVVDGVRVTAPATGIGIDPSAPEGPGYRWVQADVALVDRAVGRAVAARAAWRATPAPERGRILHAVADRLAEARGRLIGVMARDAGKTAAEGDPEVSEAIDFARWYGDAACDLESTAARRAIFEPYGTVAVVPPWNFPLAIPAGGVLAALAAGSTVIFKPAPETVATAWVLAEACWAAGVPPEVLHFVPCADDDAGRRLVTHPDVDAVILTGAWATARTFLEWRPDLALHAETSGKNAIVVTATADLDVAVADLVRSAFGHAGQKCSAASLAIVEASVYDDERFLRSLADAVRSLRPGPSWDPAMTMGPLVRPPEGPLVDALTRLGTGERWLVRPAQLGANPHLWSPGVKLGVAPGSPFHLTECFGPVLGLMRADDLDQAIAWQNQPDFGLTAGLHALDPAEIIHWRDRVRAGNLYVNRHITGAIVRRQPFGGWKRSVVGPGAKAGGRHYVASLGRWSGSFPGDGIAFGAAVAGAWRTGLAPTDESGLASEANVARHVPLARVLLRAGAGTDPGEVGLAVAAGRALNVVVDVSSAEPLRIAATGAGAVTVEGDGELAARVADLPPPWSPGGAGVDKLRLLGPASDELRLAAHDAGMWVDATPFVGDPALEALRWVREQAISITLHRHGNLTGRYAPTVPGAGPPS